MKKSLLILLTSMCAIPLAGCDVEWSWWKNKNVTIERYISLDNAKMAFDISSTNYSRVNASEYRETYSTYYKDYLGKFSTEIDSNISSSLKADSKKYINNVIHTEGKKSYEQNYLNAKSVDSNTFDTYLILNDDKSITLREVVDHDKNISGTETVIPYTTEEAYLSMSNLGSRLSSESIAWDSATYGYSKKDDVIVEVMSTTTDQYTVKFTGVVLNRITNNYNMYRLKPFIENGATLYYMDYSYSKTEVLVGSSIYGEALSSPYLLEKKESSYTYKIESLGEFDLTTMKSF